MKLTAMRNIGAEMERKLNAVGIYHPEELSALGSKEAFFRMKLVFPEVCLVHLYTLQGAIQDVDYNRLTEEMKQELKAYCERLK